MVKEWLKPYHWKPGVSANPKGRPLKGQEFGTLLKKALLKNKKAIANALIERCKKGDIDAIFRAWERLEGKVKDTLAVEGISPIVIMSNIPDIEDDIAPIDEIMDTDRYDTRG